MNQDRVDVLLTTQEFDDALRARCDVVIAPIPFFRRPTARSRPFAVSFGVRCFYIWKWRDGLWEFLVKRIRCTPTGPHLKLSLSSPSLFGMLWVAVIRAMLLMWTIGLVIQLLKTGLTPDSSGAVVFWFVLLGVNVFLQLILSAAKKIEIADHAEIIELLVELGRGKQAV